MTGLLVFLVNVARDTIRERLGLPARADWTPR